MVWLLAMSKELTDTPLLARNVLFSSADIPCLSDFGLSKIMSKSRRMKTTSKVARSLHWMSLRLLKGNEKVSKGSDVWAYGITVHYLAHLKHLTPDSRKF
jgi:serine/threonine protein kinase